MSIARLISNLVDASGGVKVENLDNVVDDWNTILNQPVLAASATTDTTNAANITTGTLATARVYQDQANIGANKMYRGDGSWQTIRTNHPNCAVASKGNCANCDGTVTTGGNCMDGAWATIDTNHWMNISGDGTTITFD